MALHQDLLEQADHLASRERMKPRQASLRRAVSSAYYGFFHLLATEGARRSAPVQPPLLRAQVQRAFVHANMKEVCQQFSKSSPAMILRPLLALPIEADLVAVASAFVALQEARHDADYNVTTTFNRIVVLQMVQRARAAFASWQAVRSNPNAVVFLIALLLQRQWR